LQADCWSANALTILDFKTFKWICEQRGILTEDRAKAKYEDGSNAVIDFGIPLLGRLISNFVVFLTKSIPVGQRLYDFRGAMLWIGEIGIWDVDSEKAAKLLFESLRPKRESIEEARGQSYGADEFVPFHAALMLVLLTGWDALIILEECDYLIEISHDEYVRLVFRDKELAAEVATYMTDESGAAMLQRPPWNLSKAKPESR
jgi:hypothetical protein